MTAAVLPTAVVLAGGFGTRLPEVSATRPKPMADIDGTPFLRFVVEHLRRCGVREVVLSVGYKAEVVEDFFGDGAAFGLRVRCVREATPLGTAGALRLALPYLGERAFVVNGDTYADVDLAALLGRHLALGAAATLAAVERDDASRFGALAVSGERLLSFQEKRPERAPGLVNAGVYVLERRVFEGIASDRPVSLEREVLPALLRTDQVVAVHRHGGSFEDIGVPESLAAFRAQASAQASEAARAGAAQVRRELEESIEVKTRWSDALCEGVSALATRTVASLRGGGKILLFGNGGSAGDAQHLAAELMGRFRRERPAWRALALHTNSSIITALANDYGYETVFARQIEAWAEPGDVVVGISTSGGSESVVRALARARELGAYAVALTGEGGGRCAAACDLLLAVPSRSTPRIQESHITLGHILCGMIEERMLEER
jgi:D-sedoheptulose 7-phosphate isomerase